MATKTTTTKQLLEASAMMLLASVAALGLLVFFPHPKLSAGIIAVASVAITAVTICLILNKELP